MPPKFPTTLFGPILIGVCLNLILSGILLLQILTYYQNRKRDPLWIRLFVLYLSIIEICNTVFDVGIIYEPLIFRYGTPKAATYFPILFLTEPLCIVLVSTPIQFFIAYRIWRIGRSPWIPIIICLLALSSFAGGLWTAIRIGILRQFMFKPLLHTPALVWFLSSCVADVLITISLVRTLYKRKTGFIVTDDRINHIIRLTVRTGAITSLAAIGDVVFFMVLPHAGYNFLWDLALGKLYSNSLLSSLNERYTLTTGPTNNNPLFGDESSESRFLGSSQTHSRNNPAVLGIHTMYPLQTLRPGADAYRNSDANFEATSPLSSKSGYAHRPPMEGITVTTMVETMEDAHLPNKSRDVEKSDLTV